MTIVRIYKSYLPNSITATQRLSVDVEFTARHGLQRTTIRNDTEKVNEQALGEVDFR